MITLSEGKVMFTEFFSGLLGQIRDEQIIEISNLAIDNEIAFATGDLLRSVMPARVAVQKDGKIWFTRNWRIGRGDSRIGKLSPDGHISYVEVPTADAGIADLAIVPSQGVFFTEYQANKIGEITETGDILEWAIPTPDSGPLGIGSTSTGIAFVERKANKIGYLTLLKGIAVPAR